MRKTMQSIFEAKETQSLQKVTCVSSMNNTVLKYII